MSPTDHSVDAILDAGAVGLVYFEKYLPILHRVTSGSSWTYPGLCARYDQQRGLDLGALEEDARLLTDSVVAARAEVDRHDGLATTLASSWVDAAGEAALADVRSDRTIGSQRAEAANQLSLAMAAAVDGIADAIERKATEIGRFDPSGPEVTGWGLVDGKPLDVVMTIDLLATLDPGESLAWGSAPAWIAHVSPFLPAVVAPIPAEVSNALPAPLSPNPVSLSPEAMLIHAKRVCDEWLRTLFAPLVSAACQHLVDICESIDRAVRDYLSTVAAVAETIDTRAFPTADAGEGAPGVGGGGGVGGADNGGSRAPSVAPDALGVAPQSTTSGGGGSEPGQPQLGGTPSASGTPLPSTPLPSTPLPSTPLPSTPMPATPDLPPTRESLLPAMKSMFGDLPSGEDVIAAIGRTGHEMTEQLKAVLGEVIGRLCESADPAGQQEGLPQTVDDGAGLSESRSGSDTSTPPQAPPPPEATPPASPPPPGGPAPIVDGSAERGHVEAAFDGHSARVSLAHNGIIALDLGSPSGENRRFELRPGPFGVPVVEQVFGPTHTGTAADAAPGVPEVPAGPAEAPATSEDAVPGDAAAVEDLVLAEDAPIAPSEPEPQPENAPDMSGAQLTEAGPL